LATEGRVATPAVVEDLDVLVDGVGGLSACRPAPPVNEFALQGPEADQLPLRMRLRELAETRRRYGYRRLTVLLQREGWAVNHTRKVVERPVDGRPKDRSQTRRKSVQAMRRGMGLPPAKKSRKVTPTQVRTEGHGGTALDWRAVAAILIAAAIPRIALAVEDHGIFWPDEIFQSLEQAHRVVFGYGFIPWEFQEGARSWLFPGMFVLLWRVAGGVGVHSAIALVVLAKLLMVALALVGVYATIRIAERLGGATAGALAGLLAATFPASLIFGHRCMAEMASGPVLAVAVLLWLDGDRRRMLLAGLVASSAIFLRYQNGLVTIGLLVALLVSARRREALAFVVGGAVGLLGGEILDWITWGAPFHSLLAYLRYNMGRSATYGVSSWSYYLGTAWSSTGVSLLAIVVGLIAAWHRARALVVVAVGFVVVHSFVPHKEYRFLMPVVPLVLAVSAVGLQAMLERFRRTPDPKAEGHGAGESPERLKSAGGVTSRESELRRRHLPAAVVGIVMSALMIVKAVDATFASTGQWTDQPEGARSVWHHWEGANLGLADVGSRGDVCAVLLAGIGAVWSGGFTYLHRDVPFLDLQNLPNPGDLLPFANYVVLSPEVEPPPNYMPLQQSRDWSVRRRNGTCVPPLPGLSRSFGEPTAP
jgi:GPI mannosyltransferase 3